MHLYLLRVVNLMDKIPAVNQLHKIRLRNLLDLRQRYESSKEFAAAAGFASAYFSQLKLPADSAAHRNIGDNLARKIEKRLELEAGYLDSEIVTNVSFLHSSDNSRHLLPIISWSKIINWRNNINPASQAVASIYTDRKDTYGLVVEGNAMVSDSGFSYFPGMILECDPTMKDPKPGSLVIAEHEGNFYFRELLRDGTREYLSALNSDYPKINNNFKIQSTIIRATITTY